MQVNKLVDMCMTRDYILKMTFSRCTGWRVRVHKNGCSMPVVDISNDDRATACDTAYFALKMIVK